MDQEKAPDTLLSTPSEKFHLFAVISKIKKLKPRVLAYMWVSV